MSIRVIIAGGRDFSDYTLLEEKLLFFFWGKVVDEVVSGCARGADSLGEQYAKAYNIPVKKFPADWNTHGKAAGYIRNKQMAEYATHLVAFWDGESKGTQHMINLAKEHGLKVRVVKY